MISYIYLVAAVVCEVLQIMQPPLFINFLRMRIFYRYIGL